MPYQPDNRRRGNPQIGIGRLTWTGKSPINLPERLLDSVPGCVVGFALAFSVSGAIFFPRTMLMIAALLALYLAIRFVFITVAAVRGLERIKAWEAIDWRKRYAECSEALAWDAVHHAVIIPNYREPIDVLRRTLDNLAEMRGACEKITVVLAMEAREEGGIEKAEQLEAEYSEYFEGFYFTVHPAGLPGEMRCKSANLAWSGRWIKRKLVDELGWNLDHITVTAMDADTLWHPDYFDALTYHFATDPARYDRFWQAPIRYHGKIYEVSPLLRLINAYANTTELGYLAASWWQSLPISSYSLSLRLLDRSDFWDPDVIADEWHMYIKAFFARHGNLKLIPIFLPFLATPVIGDSFWEEFRNRYRQALRHAWGSKEIGYTIAQALEYSGTSLQRTMRLLMSVSHDLLMFSAGWLVVTLGSQLPLLLNSTLLERLLHEGWRDPAFVMLQVALVVVSLLAGVTWYLDAKVRPPRPFPATTMGRVRAFMGFILLPLFVFIFVVLPLLHAQVKLLAGLPLEFEVTSKV